jgi:hypothetical protein
MKLPLILLAVHTLLILGIALLIGDGLRNGYQESVNIWGLAVMLDLPAVPFLGAAESMYAPAFKNEMVRWVLFPAISHVFIGGLLWYGAGWGINRLVRKAPPDPPGTA